MLKHKLLKELRKRFEKDQKFGLKIKLNYRNSKKFTEIAKDNSSWLENKINKIGWLSSDIVGKDGECYAWLIVQHSDFNVIFQEKCLKLIKKLPFTKERRGHIAYLTDRILVNKGKKQIYGTQFREDGVCPIKNKKELEKRRKMMGLGSFKKYHKLMKKIND